ncbi:LOB domain-containing protein 22-like [Juglans microcarpa x Juglans regia]|uniref:LOB domain-containing protein 22-like n=1 Tax=Juglans microcarpa x Juglans regia TaxID=2249226 RepID=UPI001B7F44F0|nr:LOB domain-containing protein 22-like [Juglans microcarpa x Juglans regia]
MYNKKQTYSLQGMNLRPRHGNGTTQACAACRYQRRKCAPDCILAPYFPHDRQKQFLNAHKLFGVSNIIKIIKNLDQPDKDEAMRTIIFQSNVRANDPVGGCCRMIRDLQRLIDYNKAELDIVLHQLAICRAQAHDQQPDHSLVPNVLDAAFNSENDHINISADPTLGSFNASVQYHYLGQHQEPYFVINNDSLQEDVNAWAVQDSLSMSSLHIKHGADDECDDTKPIFERSCERNEMKFEAEDQRVERSCEAMLRIGNAEDGSCIQQAHDHDDINDDDQDHDLKGAATLFTLTN